MTVRHHNFAHLGDLIQHAHYLRKLAKANPDTRFEFRFLRHVKNYLWETQNFLSDCPNVELITVWDEQPPPDSVDVWIGHTYHDLPFHLRHLQNHVFAEHFRRITPDHLKNPIATPQAMLFDHEKIEEPNALSGEWDYLVVNSPPMSAQWWYDPKEWAELVRSLPGSVVTTHKVEGVPATTDYRLNLLQIAHLSIRAKNVVGINTAPLLATFNKWTKARFVVADLNNGFQFDNLNVRHVKSMAELRTAVASEVVAAVND